MLVKRFVSAKNQGAPFSIKKLKSRIVQKNPFYISQQSKMCPCARLEPKYTERNSLITVRIRVNSNAK